MDINIRFNNCINILINIMSNGKLWIINNE